MTLYLKMFIFNENWSELLSDYENNFLHISRILIQSIKNHRFLKEIIFVLIADSKNESLIT